MKGNLEPRERSLDLIRELLLRFERDDTSIPDGYTEEEVAYQVNQMVKSGLVDAEVMQAPSPGRKRPVKFIFRDIEPAGHDLIARLKNDGFWAHLKREAIARAAPLTMDLIVQIATALSKQAFSL